MRYASIASVNKTIYLRDDEVSIWANDELSPSTVATLKRYVVDKESQAKGFERIGISF